MFRAKNNLFFLWKLVGNSLDSKFSFQLLGFRVIFHFTLWLYLFFLFFGVSFSYYDILFFLFSFFVLQRSFLLACCSSYFAIGFLIKSAKKFSNFDLLTFLCLSQRFVLWDVWILWYLMKAFLDFRCCDKESRVSGVQIKPVFHLLPHWFLYRFQS